MKDVTVFSAEVGTGNVMQWCFSWGMRTTQAKQERCKIDKVCADCPSVGSKVAS